VAQLGPTPTLDLSGRIEEVIGRIRDDPGPTGDELSIESVVEFVDGRRLPELYLEPSVIAKIVARGAGFNVQLRKASGAAGGSGSVPAIRAEFVIRGLGFDPAALTERIGLQPEEVNRANRVRFPRSLDTWTYGGQIVRTNAFAPMLESLLATLTPRAGAIRDFCRANSTEAVVGFVAEFVDAPPQLDVSASDCARINDLGAAVWYDVYQRERLD
jgi:hypothetical protein